VSAPIRVTHASVLTPWATAVAECQVMRLIPLARRNRGEAGPVS